MVVAILPTALWLLVSHFGERKRDRLARWRAIGLTPQTGTWEALWSWDALAGEHRGRRISMSWDSRENVTQVRVAVNSPSKTASRSDPSGRLASSARGWLSARGHWSPR